MGKYNIKITETYVFDLEIQATTKKEALEKAKKYYEECDEKYVFVADALSYEDTKFKVLKSN
ncbi:hypothetical protein [Clostridium perfringens]|jgi:hypothetical protein|uniref:hypothetical protein n=1 Tax=Clostridium perfringens TaxID=1502 RepID=UPI001CCE12BD|nr:hypothetical protein [Clostridium perfringens]EIF6155358.1 hypothetical protein [Clostridium perfringens]UBL06801.1 hypothetical protein KLF33_15870 [Clostridium perfringens]DAW04357.1 MAG TPA: PcfM DpnD/PcfM-like protein [Caudoviricetes sp.]